MSNISNVLLLLITLIYPLLPLIKEHSLIVGNIIELSLILLLVVFAIIKKEKRKILLAFPKKYLLVMLILIGAFLFYLSDFFDNDVYDTISATRMFIFYITLMAYLDSSYNQNKYLYINEIKYLLFTMSLFAAGAIIQFVYPDGILLFHGPGTINELRPKSDFIAFSVFNRCMSFFGDPNILGVFSALCLVFFHQCKSFFSRKVIYLYASGICIISILLAQSRTAILLVAIYILVNYIFSSSCRIRISLVSVLISFTIIIGMFYMLYYYWEVILNYLRIDTLLTGNGRMDHTLSHIDYLIQDDLFYLIFGHGLSVARDIVFENSYLLLFYELGLCGLILFSFIVYGLVERLIQIYSCKILFLCYLIVNVVGDYILIPQITYLSILTIYIMFFLSKEKKTQ